MVMLRHLLICSLLVPFAALAESRPWTGDTALGFLSTTGNADATTLNSRLNLVYRSERLKNTLRVAAVYGEQARVRAVERYTGSNQSDFNFDANNYAFVALEGEKDLFGGVRERTSQTVGYGRRILTGPVHELSAELGAGARQLLPQGAPERSNEAIARLSGNYGWKISDSSSFSQTLKVESGDDNTFTETVSELKLNVIGNVFTAISFTVRNNSEVPVGRKRTDTFSAVNLSYRFGG